MKNAIFQQNASKRRNIPAFFSLYIFFNLVVSINTKSGKYSQARPIFADKQG